MASIRFLGHASFQLELGGRRVLLDPWFEADPRERRRLVPPAVSAEQIRSCDVACVSNESFDHCSPREVKTIVERTNAYVVAPRDSLALLDILPRYKVSADVGDKFTLLGLEVQVFPANHPQSSYPVGYVLRGGGKSVYFAGSTYEFAEMRELDVDAAILPIGGSFTMDAIGAVNSLKMMRAKYAIPMHYNTFERIRVDEMDFGQRVKKSTKSVPVVLRVGEAAEF